uniref:RPGF2 n=1 Tax=Eptatretus burgeri TaxID=7764 RepID=A0A8C4N9H0_EPTBU
MLNRCISLLCAEHLVCMASRLPAFANMTLAVKRELCAVMLLTVVDKAGTVIHHDSEELDSWSVVLNGTAEIRQRDGNRIEIGPGEVYGIGSNMECKIMQGVMKTKTDDYQFVSVMRTDFCRILSRVEESTEREEENGSVVLVREHRVLDRSGTRKGHVVVKASPDRLLRHLVEDRSSADPSFPEDLLLTYRVFVPSPMYLASRLLQWFQNEKQLREKVTRIILLWVNNHFEDFEDDPAMTDILEKFESLLEQENMGGHLRLLAIAIDAKTSKRVLTLARPSRHEPLSFTLMITIEGTFVAAVEENGRAERIGLRRGDQVGVASAELAGN